MIVIKKKGLLGGQTFQFFL